MDFLKYFESGEETPIEIDDTFDEKKEQVIDEGLVDVLFSTIRTNLKTNVSGPLIYFRWEWMNTKTFFTLRIKKTTLKNFLKWLNGIMEDSEDNTK